MESKWLKEALFAGTTANAFKLGTVLSLGWFWHRTGGCSILYRGKSMGTIDFEDVLIVSAPDAKLIQPPCYLTHSNNMTHFYVVRRANNCGDLEQTLSGAVKISIDSNGNLEGLKPNSIFESAVWPSSGGRVKLLWYYCPLSQKSKPERFNIYCDNGTGQIDYERPLGAVSYAGRKYYSFQTEPLGAGRYLFAVRVQDINGVEDSSCAKLEIEVAAGSSSPIGTLGVEVV